MRRICVVTGSRADYGLLYWTMKAIEADPELDLQVCATGMHLSPEFGLTYREIVNDDFQIDAKVEMLLSSDTPTGISKSVGLGICGFSDAFSNLKPDIVLLLGDRFETFAAAVTAMILRIPIAHCHGGEVTEGVIDESFRHGITKMAQLHFAATDQYRNRIIQLGEDPARVFNVGAMGIENINKLTLLSQEQFEAAINHKLGTLNFLVTFHPVSLERSTAREQFMELITAMKSFKNAHIIFTKPNADTEGRVIGDLIDEFVASNPDRSLAFVSMGQLRYLSALQYVDVVIGNSSSGIIEVPAFGKPTINIGDRQRGRVRARSVIDCEPIAHEIVSKINLSLSVEFKEVLKETVNPYGFSNASDKVVDILRDANLSGIVKKQFYDIPFD